MGLKLKSGFLFDYDNLYGEGKVTKADVEAMADDLKKAHEAMKVMRSTGVIRGHQRHTAARRKAPSPACRPSTDDRESRPSSA